MPEVADDQPLVILLEDDAAERKLLVELFADEGMPVSVATTVQKIHEQLRTHPLSIILADSWAPGDHEALGEQQRRELEELAALAPVILMTGREWARQIDARALGKVQLLPKPYDLDELLERVRRALGDLKV